MYSKNPRGRAPIIALGVLLVGCKPAPGDGLPTTDGTGTSTGGAGGTSEGPTSDSDVPTTGGVHTSDSQTTLEPCMGAPPTSTSGDNLMTGDETTTEPGESCSGHPVADACCCFELDGVDVADVVVLCKHHYPCQEIVVDDFMPGSPAETSCGEAIDCSLSALAAGQPGSIRWVMAKDQAKEIGEIHMVGDGTAFVYLRVEDDLSCIVDPFTRKNLIAKEIFLECSNYPSAMERFECIRHATVFGSPVETCIDNIPCWQ